MAMGDPFHPPPPTAPAATGVPVGNPMMHGQVHEWSTDLCGCFEDPSNCLITWCCPCITFGQIAEIVDRGSSSCGTSGALYALIGVFTGCQWIYSCTYRQKMRSQYMLADSPCADCLVHFCCEPCALCQEYRELQNRGFDMNLGWHGNVERMGGGGGVQMNAPPMHGGMSR